MKCSLVAIVAILILLLTVLSCGTQKPPDTGEALAKVYCASCHLFTPPSLLDKSTWKNRVLPAMAKEVGIDYAYDLPLPNSVSPIHITSDQFNAIKNFYLDSAPDSLPKQTRQPLSEYTSRFQTEEVKLQPHVVPFMTYLKIDPGNHYIYAHNGEDSTLSVYNTRLKLMKKFQVGGVVVDMDFSNDLSQSGPRHGVLTKIGYMNPNDLKTGSVERFQFSTQFNISEFSAEVLLDSLPRPVQAISCSLDGSGEQEYLICGFGHTQGELLLASQDVNGKFERKILRNLPGAIKAYIRDFNGDGRQDIIVLMAQAQEGIYLLLNEGSGKFSTIPLLEFPPVYGSCYFELDDFNNDGAPDILYACGDNADQSSGVLKAFHGVYIFLNDGSNHFKQKYFFPMHGCYKAMAADFDNDGDLDIAAISFFPDGTNQPQESFAYLEQDKPLEFKPFIIHEFNHGSWILMDAADLDGDGDEDIVLGSLVPPLPGRAERWNKAHPEGSTSIMLLRNSTIEKGSRY